MYTSGVKLRPNGSLRSGTKKQTFSFLVRGQFHSETYFLRLHFTTLRSPCRCKSAKHGDKAYEAKEHSPIHRTADRLLAQKKHNTYIFIMLIHTIFHEK